MKGAFVSDLHLFSQRSIGQKHWDDLHCTLRNVNLLVLGGDIFDFRWSRYADPRSTTEAAEEWLSSLLNQHSHLRVAYMLGNHDCSYAMQIALSEMSKSTERFEWYEHILQLGNKAFLHGDILDAGLTKDRLFEYRKKFSGEAITKGKLANMLYDAIIASRVHRLPGQLHHTPKKTTARLSEFLCQDDSINHCDIRDVYFGHTHSPLNDKTFGGFHFYNPGSGIKHLLFQPKFFEFTEQEVALRHELALDCLALPAGTRNPAH
jgi:UDP-2,3-diacylglucosamine pyrophosphatase LpxH